MRTQRQGSKALGQFLAQRSLFLPALLVMVFLLGPRTGFAQIPESPSSHESVRVARLAALAKLWGKVKYFHPYLAYRKVDWDKALVDAIPKVSTARSEAQFVLALNGMLARLGDSSTMALLNRQRTPALPRADGLVRMAGDTLVIDVAGISLLQTQDFTASGPLLARISSSLPKAKGVILDLRSSPIAVTGAQFPLWLEMTVNDLLPQVLNSAVVGASIRYRVQNGLPAPWGSSGGYYSGFLSPTPTLLRGQRTGKQLPLVAITNENTSAGMASIAGLRSNKLAAIVHEGPNSDALGGTTTSLPVMGDVVVQIRVAETVSGDGTIGVRPDFVVKRQSGVDVAMSAARKMLSRLPKLKVDARPAQPAATTGNPDDAYPKMVRPNKEYRLLALFRFWNTIEHFFPYKQLLDEPWEGVLAKFIPRFEQAGSAVEYQGVARELARETHDSHVYVAGADAHDAWLGTFMPPVALRIIEDQATVASVLDKSAGISVGDVVLSVDGVPINQRRVDIGRWVAASTPQALNARVAPQLLRGQKDSVAMLSVRGYDGQVRDVRIARNLDMRDPKLSGALSRTGPVFQVLPSGFGYADLARLRIAEVDQMFETIAKTPATIFDMRGYPNGTAWAIAPRLSRRQSDVAALFSRPFGEATALGEGEIQGARYTFAQTIGKQHPNPYQGKVVVLIDERAISQAEHTCLFFEAATDAMFIGSPTMGANGDVTACLLPGNLTVSFTGHEVRHADGRQLQRKGIQPHLLVQPTVAGIRAGKDEVLDAAIAHLRGGPAGRQSEG